MKRSDFAKFLGLAPIAAPLLSFLPKAVPEVEMETTQITPLMKIATYAGIPGKEELKNLLGCGFTHIKWATSGEWQAADEMAEKVLRQIPSSNGSVSITTFGEGFTKMWSSASPDWSHGFSEILPMIESFDLAIHHGLPR